jgi:hypothetical protein
MVASKPVTVVGYVAALSQRIQNLPGTDPHKAALTADIAAIGPLAQQLNVAFSSAEGLRAPKKEDADRYRVLVERMRNLIELASEEEHAGTIGDPIPITWYKPWSAYQPFTIDVRGTSQTYTAGSRKDLDVGGMFADLDTIGGKLKIGVAAENRPAVDKTLKRVAASARPLGTADRFVQVLATFGFSWSGRNADHVRDLGLGGVDDVQNLWPLDAATNRAGNRIYDQWVWVKDGDDVKVSQLGRLDNLWFRIARMQ